MKKLTISLSLIALPLAGCMPMEQVSLVYSSKADIGVAVAAGTSTTPGLDLHIGYHALDAAFVPVAYAKHCAPPIDCSNVNYNSDKVWGTNSVAGLSVADQQSIDRLNDQIKGNDTQVEGNKKRIATLDGNIADIDGLSTKKARQTALGANDPATGQPKQLTSTEQTEKAALDKDIPRIEALDRAALVTERDKLKSTNDTLETNTTEAKSKRDLVAAQVNKQSSDAKTDAYSVYGTFNGSANGTGSGASLTAGKVFSTGIAAQNLTQGVSTAGRTDAMARCLDAATSLLASPALQGDDRAKDRERIAGMCLLTVRDN